MKKDSNKKSVHRATVGSRNATAVEMQLHEIKLYRCEEYEGVELRPHSRYVQNLWLVLLYM